MRNTAPNTCPNVTGTESTTTPEREETKYRIKRALSYHRDEGLRPVRYDVLVRGIVGELRNLRRVQRLAALTRRKAPDS